MTVSDFLLASCRTIGVMLVRAFGAIVLVWFCLRNKLTISLQNTMKFTFYASPV